MYVIKLIDYEPTSLPVFPNSAFGSVGRILCGTTKNAGGNYLLLAGSGNFQHNGMAGYFFVDLTGKVTA